MSKKDDSVVHDRETMSVRSIRLTDEMWNRLGGMLATANVGRRRPINLSTLVRTFIERGLERPEGLDEIGMKIERPRRIIAHQLAATDEVIDKIAREKEASKGVKKGSSLFEQIRPIVKARAISPRKFLRQIQLLFPDQSVVLDQQITNEILDFYNGIVDEGGTRSIILAALQTWLNGQTGPCD